MLKEKIQKLIDKDPLFLHKIGLTFGSIVGLAIGLIVSERADFFIIAAEEALPDDETRPDPF